MTTPDPHTLNARLAELWNRIEAKIEMVTESGCWIWMGCCRHGGYGAISFNDKQKAVHRMTYEIFNGPIPEGLQCDHLCRVRCCVNPSHLEAVANRENQLRGFGVGGIAARKTHCPRGHEYSEKNTYYHPKTNHRNCRMCNKIDSRIWRAEKKKAICAAIPKEEL